MSWWGCYSSSVALVLSFPNPHLLCRSTLANLAFNSKPNIIVIMRMNGVKAAELAMQVRGQHSSAPLLTLLHLLHVCCIHLFRLVDGCCKSLVVLQTYPNSPRLLENAVCLLSNLMFGNDDNKLEIGSTCGDEIVNVIRVSCCGKHVYFSSVAVCFQPMAVLSLAYVGFSPALRPPVLQVHFADGNLFKMSLRALGNLSYCDENIRCGAGDPFVAALM